MKMTLKEKMFLTDIKTNIVGKHPNINVELILEFITGGGFDYSEIDKDLKDFNVAVRTIWTSMKPGEVLLCHTFKKVFSIESEKIDQFLTKINNNEVTRIAQNLFLKYGPVVSVEYYWEEQERIEKEKKEEIRNIKLTKKQLAKVLELVKKGNNDPQGTWDDLLDYIREENLPEITKIVQRYKSKFS